jgi:Cdc6-like AAA superfamily ATPase
MLIHQSGKCPSDVYKKALIDRKLFSKIRCNREYKPTKATAVAFAMALELDINETEELLKRAGYALSHSNKFDVIVEYFIEQKNYNILMLNEVLFKYDQPLIGALG